MDEYHAGAALTVWLWPGAEESWDAAEADVPGNRDAQKAQLRARIALLADRGSLRSPDHMKFEGNGIYAVKTTCGLRAWGFFGQVNKRRAFIISHVVLKKNQKADPADLNRAVGIKKAFEVVG